MHKVVGEVESRGEMVGVGVVVYGECNDDVQRRTAEGRRVLHLARGL